MLFHFIISNNAGRTVEKRKKYQRDFLTIPQHLITNKKKVKLCSFRTTDNRKQNARQLPLTFQAHLRELRIGI